MLLEEVQKLNRENTEKSGHQLSAVYLDLEAGVSPQDQHLGDPLKDHRESNDEEFAKAMDHEVAGQTLLDEDAAVTEREPKLDAQDVVKEEDEEQWGIQEENKEEDASAAEETAQTSELPPVQDDLKEETAAR